MLFNSLEFVYFFPLVAFFYFWLPQKSRWLLLLVASYYFYASWQIQYAVLIFSSTVVTYFAAIKISQTGRLKYKKVILTSSIAFHLAILFLFKYFNFFAVSLNEVFLTFEMTSEIKLLQVLLPIGISFYTFQIISYTLDVYSGERKPERHFGVFALFVSFFPQLVAGPIERSGNLLPQFFEKHEFTYKQSVQGLRLIFWGLFKKVVIADRLALVVDQVYANPTDYSGFSLVLAAVFFVFQVYCDFSGYSDIAVGSAKIMGFDLTKNFNRPYASRSVSEYWRRWHISLTSWFNDYIFMPLVYTNRRRGVITATVLALLVTFSLSGLWHGAYWTFILFGLTHGFALCLEYLTRFRRAKLAKSINPKFYSFFSLCLMFTCICFVDVFFRASTVADALYIIPNMIVGSIDDLRFLIDSGFSYRSILSLFYGLGVAKTEIAIGLLLIFFLEVAQFVNSRYDITKLRKWQRWMVYYTIGLAFVFLGSFNNSIQFIYFQF